MEENMNEGIIFCGKNVNQWNNAKGGRLSLFEDSFLKNTKPVQNQDNLTF